MIHRLGVVISTLSFTVSIVAELQEVPTQTKFGARQSEFDAQVVLHAPVPQR